MTTKKPTDRTNELKQQLEQAELAERQTNSMALLKADEAAKVAGYTEERDLINQLVGQVQMANAFSKFTTVVSLTKLRYIKENKLYRTLSAKLGAADDEKVPTVRTWDGFCRLLGMTASKVDEDLKNLEFFGEDALNSLNSIGAGYRELRKLRKLPDEERELIINGEAVQAGDKEMLVELIDELAAKHAKEKGELEKRTKDLEGTLEAKDRLLKTKVERITELETEAHKKAAMGPAERAAELSARLDKAVALVKRELATAARPSINEILEWEDAPRDLRHACAQAVARMRIALDELQTDFMLAPVDLDVDDSWMKGAE
jgi:hypothetical protein